MKTIRKIENIQAVMPKQKGNLAVGTIALVVLAGVGVLWAGQQFGLLSAGSEPQVTTTSSSGAKIVSANLPEECLYDKSVTFEADALNTENAGTNYTAVTTYLVPNGQFEEYKTYTTSATATRTTAVSLNCGDSIEVYGVVSKDTASSFGPVNLGQLTSDTNVEKFEVTRISDLKLKAYDLDNKLPVYDSSDSSATDFDNVAVTLKSTTNNATATAMTASDILNWELTVQAQTADTAFGDLRTLVAVDADKTDYDTPVIKYEGRTLTDIKSSLHPDDQAVISGYEYVYELPEKIPDSPRDIEILVEPKDGVNPDVDIKLRFLGESNVLSQDSRSIKQLIFSDADSTELMTSTANTVTIDIS